MIDADALLSIPLLAGLNDAARRELAARSAMRTFGPGEVLWNAGAEPRGFFVVLEGEVRVVRSVGGRQHVIHVEGPGGTLGDVALFAGERYPATAIASRRTTCVAVTRDGLLAAIRQDPELALALLGRLAARVRQLIGRLDGATSLSVTSRGGSARAATPFPWAERRRRWPRSWARCERSWSAPCAPCATRA